MSDRVFFDTNILVYAFDKGEPLKNKIAFDLVTQGYQTQNAVISAQVLKEFFVTVTQKTAKKMSQKDAEQAVRDFALWTVVETSVTLVIEGIAIHRKHRLSFWDAMIVAAAKESHCPVILSEDMSHDSVIENIRVMTTGIAGGLIM